MKIKVVVMCFFLMACMAHASNFQLGVVPSQGKLVPQKVFKTEIFIDNDSNSSIWVQAGSARELLPAGFLLHLYNDEEEMDEIPVRMSKSLLSEIFFDDLVPNHARLKVKDYLVKR